MKLVKIISTATALVLSTSANAALIDRGNGMIFDSDRNITWLADANYAKTSGYDSDGMMSYSQAQAWVNGLSYGGYNDWRLPLYSTNEFYHLFISELGGVEGEDIALTHNANYSLFSNIQSYTGIYSFSDAHYLVKGSVVGDKYGDFNLTFNFNDGLYSAVDYGTVNHVYAWAVRDGDVTSSVPPPPPSEVPVPAAIWLFGSGLLGLIGAARRKNL